MVGDIEARIGEWRGYLSHRAVLRPDDVQELEGHLRDQIEGLSSKGLSDDESFLIAVGRLGKIDELSREYAREHSDRLWKQLIGPDEKSATARQGERRGFVLALVMAVGAGLAVKLPWLLGLWGYDSGDFILRNAPAVVLVFLAGYLLLRRRASVRTWIAVAVPFAVAFTVMNAFPFVLNGMTLLLAAVHMIVGLWLATGIAYMNGAWRSHTARMDFLRFTGEWFVYLALIALGGGLLAGLTLGVFSAVGANLDVFVSEWMIPCGAAGAVVIAAWLVEIKQSVIENIAPVLTRLFTPLFTALLLALIVAAGIHGSFIEEGRELLILFDIVLLVVAALLLYSISARDPQQRVTWFDRLQLVMIVAALVVDVFVLVALAGRIGEYGASANKLVTLGVNLVLLANLVGAGWWHLRFITGRAPFAVVERWQTAYLPVYAAWAAVVVLVIPPVFGFA
ncbi:permease prefix domain 1-containing protein [Microbacterium horticulturae]|uniref:Permease prefix domain 1-containing protein n=1 Tax=Microbacterium horticulturae TaxID=3028316 RepID=A0ABY8BWQ1_9MICO|nr:permease prefix domain 1-containing protein [Microbacterium sp. KACC 23027]WEG07552.1 permease prefix domain 1-containing protein [Microbacterium sp. KACC 23027]